MWGRKKNQESHPQEVPEINPTIVFELVESDKTIKVQVFWEPNSPFDINLFTSAIDILNRGKLYEVIKKAISKQGQLVGEVELAETINTKLKNPSSIDDEKPLIPPAMVSRHHLNLIQSQNLSEE